MKFSGEGILFGRATGGTLGARIDPDCDLDIGTTGPAILIVDDDPVCRAWCVRALNAQDHSLITACTGQDAVNVALAFYPAVILMDLHLPDMNASLVHAKILESWPAGHSQPVWLGMTACHETAARSATPCAGFRAVLTKPFTSSELLKFVVGQYPLPLSHPPAGPGLISPALQAMFLADLHALLEDLDGAFSATDWNRCAEVLHRIRGSAAQVGYTGFAKLGKELAECLGELPGNCRLVETYLDFLSQAAGLSTDNRMHQGY